MMPTKENGSGGQQPHDPASGEYGDGSGSKAETAKKGFENFGGSQSEFKQWRVGATKKYAEIHFDSPIALVNPNRLSEEEYDSLKADFPFLKGDEFVTVPVELQNSKFKSKEEYERKKNEIIGNEAKEQEQRKATFAWAFENSLKAKKDFISEAKSKGFSDKQSEKIYKASQKFDSLIEEAQKVLSTADKKEGGYIGGKSHRAWQAQEEGKFPASVVASMLGVSKDKAESVLKKTEWHHTGGTFFNETDFYDISEAAAVLEGDFDNEEGIKILKEIYG